MNKLCLAGCGDIGVRVAERAAHSGYSPIIGMIRTPEKAERLVLAGIDPVLINLDDPDTMKSLPVADSFLLYSAPPPGGGFADTRVRNFCSAMERSGVPQKIVYISTTAVYGEVPAGEWITETSPATPTSSRGRRRLDAEETFSTWGREHNVPVIILRVVGIYGPGRLPLSQLLSGQPVLVPEESKPTNRIHADDLADVCCAAMEKGEGGAVYNVCDGYPGTLTEYFTAVAELLELPLPRQVSMQEAEQVMSPLMLSYVREGHLISNAKMLKELGVSLRYPTLAEGLPGCRPEGWMPPAGS